MADATAYRDSRDGQLVIADKNNANAWIKSSTEVQIRL